MSSVAFLAPLPRATRGSAARRFPVRPPSRNAPVRAQPRQAPVRMVTEPAPTPAPAPASSVPVQDGVFSWVEQWYPVCWEVDFDESKPHAFTLWDTSLVMFRDSRSREFVVLDDECTHRAAPLSEGRVFERVGKDGQVGTVLECGYHGWRFDASGTCVDIPQNPADVGIPTRANMSKRYATTVALGLVFVFFGDPSNADPAYVPLPPHILEADPADRVIFRDSTRYLPYDFLTLNENVLDPAHVPWSHHGTSQGNRNWVARGSSVSVRDHDLASGVMAAEVSYTADQPPHSIVTFRPPCLIFYRVCNVKSKLGDFTLTTVAAPAGRGQSKICSFNCIIKPPKKLRRVLLLTPRWVEHTRANLILDGDGPLLVGQERTMQEKRRDGYGGAWKDNHVLTRNDDAVLAYRKWVDTTAASMPWRFAPGPMPTVPLVARGVALDRYNGHTKNCASCRTALSRMLTLRIITGVLATACGVLFPTLALFTLALFGTLWEELIVFTGATLLVALAALALFRVLSYWISLLRTSEIAYKLNHSL